MTTDTGSTSNVWPALKRGYALGTLVIGSLSMLVGGIIIAVLGGDGQAIVVGSSALAIGIALSLAPVIIGVKQDMFGMAVVAASGARMIIALAIVVIATVAMDLSRKPLGLGVGAGLLISLIAETMLAITILSRVSRKTELA